MVCGHFQFPFDRDFDFQFHSLNPIANRQQLMKSAPLLVLPPGLNKVSGWQVDGVDGVSGIGWISASASDSSTSTCWYFALTGVYLNFFARLSVSRSLCQSVSLSLSLSVYLSPCLSVQPSDYFRCLNNFAKRFRVI